MRRLTYKEIGPALRDKKEFRGNTMRATWVGAEEHKMPVVLIADMHFRRYVVYSYGTPIAYFDYLHGVKIPDKHWSRTTSRHQGMCRTWL